MRPAGDSVGSSNARLILLRHGESTANASGLFTGVLDVALTEQGVGEARRAGTQLRNAAIFPDVVFTSELLRARQTAEVVESFDEQLPPSIPDWRLDERNYGALTGRSKAEVLAQFGQAQFLDWRRSVSTSPPEMTDDLYATLSVTPLFTRLPAAALSRGESLRDVITRVNSFYSERVAPFVASGRCVMVVGHGNSLRALCGVLDELDDVALRELNIPTGQPLVYRFGDDLRPIVRGGEYLDGSTARAAALMLAKQGGT